MNTIKEWIQIEPLELIFRLESGTQISSTFQIFNKTHESVAFKVLTNNIKKFSVNPIAAIILPNSKCDILVQLMKQTEVSCSSPMLRKEKFLVKSAIVSEDTTMTNDEIIKMFRNLEQNLIYEIQFGVAYDSCSLFISKNENRENDLVKKKSGWNIVRSSILGNHHATNSVGQIFHEFIEFLQSKVESREEVSETTLTVPELEESKES